MECECGGKCLCVGKGREAKSRKCVKRENVDKNIGMEERRNVDGTLKYVR